MKNLKLTCVAISFAIMGFTLNAQSFNELLVDTSYHSDKVVFHVTNTSSNRAVADFIILQDEVLLNGSIDLEAQDFIELEATVDDPSQQNCQIQFSAPLEARKSRSFSNSSNHGVKNEYLVFPNPAGHFFDVLIEHDQRLFAEISLYDCRGQQVHFDARVSPGTYRIYRGHWSSGAYYLSIKMGNQVSNQIIVLR